MKKHPKNGSPQLANPLTKILAEIRDELREHNRLTANAHKTMFGSLRMDTHDYAN